MVTLPQAHDNTMGAMIAPAPVVSLRPSPDVKQYPTAPILSRENSPASTKNIHARIVPDVLWQRLRPHCQKAES